MIILKIKGSKEERQFEKAVATRLLSLPKTAYELPEDSPYELVNNELKRRANQGADSEPKKEGVSRRSKKPRK